MHWKSVELASHRTALAACPLCAAPRPEALDKSPYGNRATRRQHRKQPAILRPAIYPRRLCCALQGALNITPPAV